MRTISPTKLEKRLKALIQKHQEIDGEIIALLAEQATNINSEHEITILKRKKCMKRTAIAEVQAQLKAANTEPAPPAPVQEAASAEALPDDTILIFTQQPAHNLQAVAA